MNRRTFFRRSLLASSVVATSCFEERTLAAHAAQPETPAQPSFPRTTLPHGRIGKVALSRLICGGNLISGFAHSRDLIYVSALLQQYFTDEKVFATLALCEAHGINTAILRLDDRTLRILRTYWKERGGKLQWIAQVKISTHNRKGDIQQAVDNGAVGVFIHGGVADDLVAKGQVELLGEAVDFIRKNGVIAGVAGHDLAVHKACEKAGVRADFYMKTFNSKRYWSAGPLPRHDSVWEETPQETAAFMQEVERPWIAYKVLGAGAIHPEQGFQYAFQHGADFLCVGMFDFQVAEDARLLQAAYEKARLRNREWYG
jgi:hypothetical protein